MNAAETLRWIEEHGTQILIQSLPKCRRPKNKIIVGYRDSAGEMQACGGYSIPDAIAKAQSRLLANKTFSTANDLAVSGAETGLDERKNR